MQERESKLSISDLKHATERSAALDVATDTPLNLFPKIEYYKLTTSVRNSGNNPGRSRLTSQGFIVHPGIVDGDSKEEIRIRAYVRKEMQTDAGDRMAQLLLFPYIQGKATPVGRIRVLGVLENMFWQWSMIRDLN